MHTGIDLGLNVTAIVSLEDKGRVLYEYCFGAQINDPLKFAVGSHPMVRYSLYYNKFLEYFNDNEITGTVVMEIPFRVTGKANQLYELKGVYLLGLSSFFKPDKVKLVSPSEIKKFITGDGGATKEMVIESLVKQGYAPKSSHIGDSTAMALMSFRGFFGKKEI